MLFAVLHGFFFFKQKTAYEMRISDWSSDVCSSDLKGMDKGCLTRAPRFSEQQRLGAWTSITRFERPGASEEDSSLEARRDIFRSGDSPRPHRVPFSGQEPSKDLLADQFPGSSRNGAPELRSAEHTSELQSLMRLSYAVL